MKKYATVETAKSTRILHKRVDLVLPAHGSELEEREPGVHREHHDGAQQDEQRVAARFQRFHCASLREAARRRAECCRSGPFDAWRRASGAYDRRMPDGGQAGLGFSTCSSSPLAYISRRMSQPPTNSPLT